ncbi:phosphotransferase family protein [uncultured Jatrophihabitans sp.]|uniref:phosphotransferase family protein n=1 Tax=uncultured Jatrophihabitans sp. TaxID=1610747 RepID=UPI0035CA2D0F
MPSTELPGIRAAAVSDWITAHVPGAARPYEVALISGGRSNLTYRVDDAAGHAWVLRRPPIGELLQTAHDMTREWDFISALAGTDVPVPVSVGICDDTAVTGAPFYLTEWCPGTVLGDATVGATLAPDVRRTVALSTATVLGRLHTVDPSDVGLVDYARPGNYLARQLSRWQRQIHASLITDLRLADEVHDLLVARVPDYPQTRIVHGDYRPGNAMYADTGELVAVLDWELATLGDPLADLGWLLGSWAQPEDAEPSVTATPTTAGGYPPRSVLIEAYVAAAGREPSDLEFYLAFARWRAACVHAGVYTRDVERGRLTAGDDLNAAQQYVVALLDAARSAL